MRSINTSLYVRYTFQVDDISTLQGLLLEMRYDDGYIAYLNGIEVARQNAPDELPYDARATDSRSTDEKTAIEPV